MTTVNNLEMFVCKQTTTRGESVGADLGSLQAAGRSGRTPAAEPAGSSAPSAGSRTSGSPQLAGLLPGRWGTSRSSSAKAQSVIH